MNREEIIEECINTVRKYIVENNYHINYPERKMFVFTNAETETKEEYELFIKMLKDEGFTVIYSNALDDDYYITALDNINKNTGDELFKLEETNKHKEESIDLSNVKLKLYNIDKISTRNLKYWLK